MHESATKDGQIIFVRSLNLNDAQGHLTDFDRKYEHAKTFGVISSPSANIIWTPDSNSSRVSTKVTGAGRAVVAANEEVLCWDVKKGELLSRWREAGCKAQVSAIAQSKVDREFFAVG